MASNSAETLTVGAPVPLGGDIQPIQADAN